MIEFEPLTHSLGLKVHGVSCAQPLASHLALELHRRLTTHGVLVFPRQALTHEQHVRFSQTFGELDDHSSIPEARLPDFPEIVLIQNEGTGRRTGERWHSDLSFTTRPALGSVAIAHRLPPAGGDTMFANMQAAFDDLSSHMQLFVMPLSGVHTKYGESGTGIDDAVVQPLVRVHPETDRRALYVSEKVVRILELRDLESRAVLDLLCSHFAQPEYVYRHRWQIGDVVVWDNRVVNHLAPADYDLSEARVLTRTTIVGGPSGRALDRCDFEI